jgi:RNA polymerase sigma factor (sigma-70 family)
MTQFPSVPSAIALDDMPAISSYARTGDPRAFEVIVQRYQSMVLATCRRVLGSTTDAEDAAQETFLKLAQSAGQIRANAAAWLHACAVRTSIDLMRKRGVRRAAEQSRPEAEAPDARTWLEIRPIIDEALGELSDEDRELIVTRFLMCTPQVDMAQQAGVNPGTMHRRIDKAVEHLRTKLASRGLAIGAGAVLIGALAQAEPASAQMAMTGSLMKVGLSGVGSGAAVATGIGASKLIIWSSAAVLALAALAGGYAMLHSAPPPEAPAAKDASTPIASASVPRPEKALTELLLVKEIPGGKNEEVECDGKKLRFKIMSPDGANPQSAVARIVKIDSAPNKGKLTVQFEEIKIDHDPGVGAVLLATELNGTYAIDDNTATLTFVLPENMKMEQGKPVKLPPWIMRMDKRGEAQPGSTPTPITGKWNKLNNLMLDISSEEIAIKTIEDQFVLTRSKVLEWKEEPGFSRVQVICVQNVIDEKMIGKRVKLLIRKDANGYTTVQRDSTSPKINEWPLGFDPKLEPNLLIATWRKSK